MKKLLAAILILSAGALASARLYQLADGARAAAVQRRGESAVLTNQMTELTATCSNLQAEVSAKRTKLARAKSTPAPAPELLDLLSKPQSRKSRRAVSPELRQRLGIKWDNSSDYVLVSKAAVRNIWFSGLSEQGVVSPTLSSVLGLTPEERATLETIAKHGDEEFRVWLKSSVQRIEPSGDVLADYRVAGDPQQAMRLAAQGKLLLAESLGPERTDLMEQFSGPWMTSHGNMGAQGFRFTVRRPETGQPNLWWQVSFQNGGGFSAPVTPKSFPSLFDSVFPGGWRELAQREGFELPSEFSQ